MFEKIATAEGQRNHFVEHWFTLSWEVTHPEHSAHWECVFIFLHVFVCKSISSYWLYFAKESNNHHLLINVLSHFPNFYRSSESLVPPSWKRTPWCETLTPPLDFNAIASLNWRPSCWVSLVCKEWESNLICNFKKQQQKSPIHPWQVSVLPLLHSMQLSAFEIKGKLNQKSQGQECTILKQGVSNAVFQPSTKGCFTGNFSGLMLVNY